MTHVLVDADSNATQAVRVEDDVLQKRLFDAHSAGQRRVEVVAVDLGLSLAWSILSSPKQTYRP